MADKKKVIIEETTRLEHVELADVLSGLVTRSVEERRVLALAMLLPSVSGRIDRKINMGNYESLGIGLTIYQPVGMTPEDEAIFQPMVAEALRNVYNQAATEMNKRVDAIKSGGKKPKKVVEEKPADNA